MRRHKHKYKLTTLFVDGHKEVAMDLPEINNDTQAKLGLRRLVNGFYKLDPTMAAIESITIMFGERIVERWDRDQAFSPAE